MTEHHRHLSGPDWFHPGELEAQRRWGTEHRWDEARAERLLWDGIPEEHMERVAKFPFLFLSTSDGLGHCSVSFKGGGDLEPGVLRIVDRRHVSFPDFDGNGAFMSLGNILVNPHVGILLVDFQDGARLRIEGVATIHETGPPMEWFPDADRVLVVEITRAIPNCKRFVPKLIASPSREDGERDVPDCPEAKEVT